MVLFRGDKVTLSKSEYRKRLAKAYVDGWTDALVDTPFFNGHYIDKALAIAEKTERDLSTCSLPPTKKKDK